MGSSRFSMWKHRNSFRRWKDMPCLSEHSHSLLTHKPSSRDLMTVTLKCMRSGLRILSVPSLVTDPGFSVPTSLLMVNMLLRGETTHRSDATSDSNTETTTLTQQLFRPNCATVGHQTTRLHSNLQLSH